MSGEFSPTDEQLACVDSARVRGGPSLELEAYAGCSKSTTLALIGHEIKVPTLVTAFGNRNVKDLGPRFARPNFTVKTFNSLGQGAWLRGLPAGVVLELDDRKLGRLTTASAKRHQCELTSEQWDTCREIPRLAMQHGLVPDETNPCTRGLTPDEPWEWESLALRAGALAVESDMLTAIARDTLVESIAEAKRGRISFADQIYMPLFFGGKFGQWPVVMVDETQDLDPLMHELIARCMRPEARMFAAGDRKQAIMAWRGAKAESIEDIRRLRGEWTAKPLHTTFRCPRVIVERQQGHAPGFKAAGTAPRGLVAALGMGLDETWDWEAVARLANALPGTPGITILCRNNAPLLSLAFALLRNAIPIHVLGRDIGKGLSALVTKLAPRRQGALGIDAFQEILAEWEKAESTKATVNGHVEVIDGINDRVMALRAIITGSGAKDTAQLVGAIELIFREPPEGGRGRMVQLSTIHRFKGLEDDVIVHLDPWRVPSKRARELARPIEDGGDGGLALAQERNLHYVCETRTRQVLVNANLESFL